MNRDSYIKECEQQLNNELFYTPLDTDPNEQYTNQVSEIITCMKKNDYISQKEYQYLTEDLHEPRIPVFYGIPKLHKKFKDFPPLRPIVSGFKSCTCRLSEFIDSFLKFQAQKCNSYIRDTKHFIQKITSIKKLPESAILVTMDVASLYTNIDQQEGANACYEKLETRLNKSIPSLFLKRIILLVLQSNAFRFGDKFYQQIKGTAMGTPMAPNYANLFMDNFEQSLLHEYSEKFGKTPLVWYRYIDDIFFIWNDTTKSLEHFITFIQGYSQSKKMKSNIKFEVHSSNDNVNFLDVNISLHNGELKTKVYEKITNAHLYLNKSSCHPGHVIKNIPKGQFVRIRRICSNLEDYLDQSTQISKTFHKTRLRQ